MWVVKLPRESVKNCPNLSLFTIVYSKQKMNPMLSILRFVFEVIEKYSLM